MDDPSAIGPHEEQGAPKQGTDGTEGLQVWECSRGAHDGPAHPQEYLTNSSRSADTDQTSSGLTELGASIEDTPLTAKTAENM